MRTGMFSLIANVIASVFILITLAVVESMTTAEWLIGISVLTALGAIVAMWLVWALNQLGPSPAAQPAESKAEKRKRDDVTSDARLALLMQLMDEDERKALKKRLLEEMDSDGEAVPLSALLGDQERRQRGS